jgi:hypothetical protein
MNVVPTTLSGNFENLPKFVLRKEPNYKEQFKEYQEEVNNDFKKLINCL